jgi:phenylalanyl-tRNA synthetase alpha chain
MYHKAGKMTTFKPYSKYPPCPKDVSFWLPTVDDSSDVKTAAFHDNDMYEIVREIAGDLVEEVNKHYTP